MTVAPHPSINEVNKVMKDSDTCMSLAISRGSGSPSNLVDLGYTLYLQTTTPTQRGSYGLFVPGCQGANHCLIWRLRGFISLLPLSLLNGLARLALVQIYPTTTLNNRSLQSYAKASELTNTRAIRLGFISIFRCPFLHSGPTYTDVVTMFRRLVPLKNFNKIQPLRWGLSSTSPASLRADSDPSVSLSS